MMYKINLATEIIKSNTLKFKFFKVVNFITVIICVTVLAMVGYTSYKKIVIDKLETEITSLIDTIDNKRSAEVLQMEQLWEEYNFQLLAVSEQLSNSTKYGLMLKEFSNNLPNEVIASSISISGDKMHIKLNVPQNTMQKLKSFYDYVNELKTAFEKCVFINGDSIKIISWVTEIDKKKSGFETLDVEMSLNSRKRL